MEKLIVSSSPHIHSKTTTRGIMLDVLIALCDRIMVISSGQVTGMVDARNTTKEEIGLLMTKHNTEGGSAHE